MNILYTLIFIVLVHLSAAWLIRSAIKNFKEGQLFSFGIAAVGVVWELAYMIKFIITY